MAPWTGCSCLIDTTCLTAIPHRHVTPGTGGSRLIEAPPPTVGEPSSISPSVGLFDLKLIWLPHQCRLVMASICDDYFIWSSLFIAVNVFPDPKLVNVSVTTSFQASTTLLPARSKYVTAASKVRC